MVLYSGCITPDLAASLVIPVADHEDVALDTSHLPRAPIIIMHQQSPETWSMSSISSQSTPRLSQCPNVCRRLHPFPSSPSSPRSPRHTHLCVSQGRLVQMRYAHRRRCIVSPCTTRCRHISYAACSDIIHPVANNRQRAPPLHTSLSFLPPPSHTPLDPTDLPLNLSPISRSASARPGGRDVDSAERSMARFE